MERSVERWRRQDLSDTEELENAAAASALVEDTRPEVLICEDNPDMRELLSFVISKEYRVRVARNGREGLEAVQCRAPDLVLTDVMMPEMSGTELCRAIKGDPELVGLPVVLVTSKAEREMKIELSLIHISEPTRPY